MNNKLKLVTKIKLMCILYQTSLDREIPNAHVTQAFAMETSRTDEIADNAITSKDDHGLGEM